MVRTGRCCASFILQIFVEPAWAGFASQHGQDWGMPHILHFTDFCSASQPPLTNGQGPCGPLERRTLRVTDQWGCWRVAEVILTNTSFSGASLHIAD